MLLAASCGGPREPSLPPSSAAVPPAPDGAMSVGAPYAVSTLPDPPAAVARAIAIAEDQRRYDADLRRSLGDPAPAVRARAVLAVGRLQDSTSVRDVTPLLSDSVVEVRREAAFALGQIGHRSARAALEAKLKDGDGETVDLAIEALGKLGDKAATAEVAAFLRAASPRFRAEAAVALWRLADSTALPALLAAQADPDAEVRWRVLYALEKLHAPDQVVLIAALHLGDPEWLTRAYAARTIGRQKSSRGTAYLIQALADGEVPVVVNAIRGLQSVADSTSPQAVRQIARRIAHEHPYVRATAATALDDRWVWTAADSALRRAVLDSLRAHLADRDAATRGASARGLIHHGDPADLGRVTAALAADSSIYTRVAILAALPAARVDLLRARLAKTAPLFERMTAADRLGELKLRSETAALRAGLRDTSFLFVASCAGALAALGDTASVPVLVEAFVACAGTSDADARIALRDALKALGGAALADSLEKRHPPRNAKPSSYADDFAALPAAKGAVLHTTAGDIEWAFYGREATQTVKNFARLAERGYFDGLALHRVVPNFVIQDGDPTGTGSGGPGYTIRCEYNRLRYDPGMVGMALSGKDTGGSQWFITHSPQHHLDGRYTIFARVTRGMDVVARTVQGDRVLKVEILH
ncbi:MAG: HEAT repeat domain-containing protein [Candidatus Eisenbacteria bacterium]|nr:HEAT repeat domain-containing protein [Candidatus Eisenbacteria bacterium]